MKVFLIIPTLKQGGAERVVSVLSEQFSQKGYETHLILLAQADDFYEISKDVKIHRLGFQNKNPFQKIFSEISVFNKLRKLFREEQPDSILSFMTKYNLFTIIAGWRLKIPIYVSDRSSPYEKLPFIQKTLRKLLYKHAHGIVAQTLLAKTVLFEETGSKNIDVIPNPIKQIDTSQGNLKENIILNVGRLVKEKGQLYLIEAFAKLNTNEWKLVVLGSGPEEHALKERVKNLSLSDNVIFPGSTPNVDEWYLKSKIFAFPSISEGFPNALCEAMSSGLACVSFDCNAGPSDIIENEQNGILIPEKNVDELYRSLKYLMENERIREEMGRNASKIGDQLNQSNIADKYLKFILGQTITPDKN